MRRAKNPFGSRAKKPVEPPAPRRFDLEELLCRAMRDRVRVDLRYDDDLAYRSFEPSAVYETSRGKICVSGVQISNANDFTDESGPHNFEVGRICDLRLTDAKFIPDPRFDRSDPKYRFGIICSV